MPLRRALPLAAALLLNACASYHALPLQVGVPVTLDVIARDAATIRRPYLAPVTVGLTAPLDANAVATIAVAANPELKALRARAGVADAQVFAAGLLPDPTVALGIDKVLAGPDMFANLVSSVGVSLAALRSRSAVLARAKASARQVRLDLAWAEWQTAGQARLQAVRIVSLQRIVGLQGVTRDASATLFERSLRAAARGDLTPDQVQAARLAAFDATDRLRIAERDLGAARFELTRLLGLPSTMALSLAPQPFDAPAVDANALATLAISERFDIAALRAGYDAQEAGVRKAILDQFPTLDLSINLARDTTPNTLLGPGIGFTLPLWNRGRGGIAVEQATRAALRAEFDARVAQVRAEIAA